MKSLIIEILVIVLAGLAIVTLINVTLQYSVVDGSSMEPNLHDGQRLLINKIAYNSNPPQRGEIIVFPPPHIANPDKDYIKRVIGLPGETIEIRGGVIYVNGSPLDEPYIEEPASGSLAPRLVPDNEYFVLGDNRNNSTDSRQGWTVPLSDIVGKAWISIWPPQVWGLAPNYSFPQQLGDTLGQVYVFISETD